MTADSGGTGREIVVVPGKPGPLVALDPESSRTRDDLDDLIDDLFPAVEERPGWFDAGLVVVGVGLLALGVFGGGPTFVPVVGVAAIALGCILPLRTAWRRVKGRRRQQHRAALLAIGVPVDLSSPSTRRLVQAYEDLIELEDVGDEGVPALAAAHGALIEAASLLAGRAPASGREDEYVVERAKAIEALVLVLRSSPDAAPTVLDIGTLVEARDELDRIAGFNSVTRLEALTDEARTRRRGPA